MRTAHCRLDAAAADRTEEELLEPAATPRADDEELGAGSGLEDRAGGVVLDEVEVHVGRRAIEVVKLVEP